MVQLNLNSIFESFPSRNLTSQEKEDMYDTIVQVQLEPDLSPDKLTRLFEVSQEILKYKGEQVDSLLADLDILASTHGVDEMREELAKTGRQTEQLEEELQAKERELIEEKARTDKLLLEIADLQKEKNDLRREILLIQQEKRTAPAMDSGEDSVDVDQLKENIQQKNKHIMQLLADIESLEKENETVRSKMSSVRREMSEATTNLTKLTGENISLRQTNYESREKITVLEERNAGLVSQVSELVEERRKKDAQLDELIDALEARVAKWQEVLSSKDNELAELRTRLNEVQSNPTPSNYKMTKFGILTKSLEKQEKKIVELQDHLVQATEDLTKSTTLLQEFKKRAEARELGEESMNNLDTLKEDLENAHTRIAFLEDKLNDAEQDAQARAEEMTELIIELREYEDGVYGLKEARNEIRDLKIQVKVRDKQILRLVEQTNKLHLKASNNEVEGENYEVDEIENDTNDSSELRSQLRQYQQTAVNLSMQNYDLRAEIINLKKELDKLKEENEMEQKEGANENQPEETKTECEGCKELQKKVAMIVDENEGLRKGLHEILDSVHNHDGTSSVAIESECLESLLAALDSRHISGWYHPAMRLQVDVNKLEGNNTALRNELRETRLRESYFQAELQLALLRIDELEKLLENSGVTQIPVPVPRQNVTKKTLEEDKIDEEAVRISEDDLVSVPSGGSIHQDDSQRGSKNGSSKSEGESVKDKKGIASDCDSVEEEIAEEVLDEEIGLEEKSTQTELDSKKPETKDVGINGEPVNGELSSPQEAVKPKNGGKGGGDVTDSFLIKFTKIEQNEDELREKCDELRQELEKIRSVTESTLSQLSENKDKMFAEVGDMMKKVDLQIANMMSNTSTQTNELVVATFQAQENKLAKYESELTEVRKTLSDREASLAVADKQLTDLKEQLTKAAEEKESFAESRVEALKTTLEGLQATVNEKEESIVRYQKLLEETKEEHEKLLEKYKEIEHKSSAKSSPRSDKMTESKAITILMEKWLAKVRSLEEHINILGQKLADADEKLNEAQKEVENWKDIATNAEERFTTEIEERLTEANRKTDELKTALKQQKLDSDNLLKEKMRGEHIKLRKRDEEFRYKVREYENEISKLKTHLSSRTSRTRNTNSAKKECLLLDRIKALEEELEECKNREQSNIQMRRDKCTEEFNKWDEKKRLQSTNEKLKNELREKTSQTETFESQISRLKQIISRMERERIALQRRLKITQDYTAKNVLTREESHMANEGISELPDDNKTDANALTVTPRSLAESAGSSNYTEEAKTKGRSKRDLEKAIIALKKVVVKLRAENSQIPQRAYVEHLQKELQKVQESYVDAVERTLLLEEKLQEAESKFKDLHSQTYVVDGGGDRSESVHLREQLNQKCELLSRVKVLLQRAIMREKELVEEVTFLRKFAPKDKSIHVH